MKIQIKQEELIEIVVLFLIALVWLLVFVEALELHLIIGLGLSTVSTVVTYGLMVWVFSRIGK